VRKSCFRVRKSCFRVDGSYFRVRFCLLRSLNYKNSLPAKQSLKRAIALLALNKSFCFAHRRKENRKTTIKKYF
ncbi:MAG: hypothetical protein ACYTX0_38095, partial [Nostoc sp.]